MENYNKLTEVTPEELADAWKDEFGVLYSKDRKRLLRSTDPNLVKYEIPKGTKIICKEAFSHVDEEEGEFESWRGYTVGYVTETSRCKSLIEVSIPSSVVAIGFNAFYLCENLASVYIEPGLKYIGAQAFKGCYKLCNLVLPNTIEDIEHSAFKGCNRYDIVLPKKFQNQIIFLFGK